MQRRRKESSFTVESKVFEVVLEEKKGKPQITIVEKKGGVSSWIRLGLESLGFFLEGLIHCIKDTKEGKWVREWKEKGRSYYLTRGLNGAGWYLQLGVADSERKRFSIFILKGRGDKGGWVIMAKKLQKMEGVFGKKINKQEARVVGKSVVEKSFVEVLKGSSWRSTNVVRVKVKMEETLGILQKLGNCIATSWGLTRNLGLARMEKNRVLLEFEILEEARWVVASGNRSQGGLQLDLEFWNPRSGCRIEEEESEEIWVKIVGLPVSMWNPMILRRVREECGGFVAIDPQTKSLGELQWACILVKKTGDFLPSVLEMEIEEDVYTLSLWWELRPALKNNTVGCNEVSGRKRDEVRGEFASCAGKRVEKELADAMCGPLTPPTEGMGDQGTRERDLIITMGPRPHKSDPSMGPKEARRMDGPVLSSCHMGSKSMQEGAVDDGLEEGPSFRRWVG
ncbi:hypothetical protein PVL29_005879 [Vitis rotundifolia]|uniref:DUF4283 domain-containing protein n=1 Tax=Vitis rotundifolia TaxID=103349 RepID=A0AA39DYN1_VITRO|nr:hypothetical protein PVL29_005879 [Vitis rotundifolia]